MRDPWELALFYGLLGMVVWRIAQGWTRRRHAWILVVAALGLAVSASALWQPWQAPPAELAAPTRTAEQGYVSSDTCRSCHPSQYASWHRTYHRTMTQVAGPNTLRAPLQRATLENRGLTTLIEPREGTLWVDMLDQQWEIRQRRAGLDPAAVPNAPRIRGLIALITGSHHMQAYWLRHSDGSFIQVPWMWQIEEQRWIPTVDSFLHPGDRFIDTAMPWNQNCLQCHTVGALPRIDRSRGGATTRVGELGIACEACHGPAQEHIRANRNPLRRYAYHLGGKEDPTIVNPADQPSRISTEICGQCHSVRGFLAGPRWLETGVTYRPGEDFSQVFVLGSLNPRKGGVRNSEIRNYFWDDGTVRVAGREYNGLLESACFQKGDLSCLSCHSMHDSEPVDQLAADRAGDEACLSCHPSYRDRISEHTNHQPGSSGSACYNCHMPHTTYGLFVAMRSHRIDSPSAVVSHQTGRPNACNQCHIDRSLAWTAEHLEQWYGHETPALTNDHKRLPAAIVWLLRGDAAQRAVAAWTLGWEAAWEVAGRHWQAPFLAQNLDDSYSAVRLVTYRSLRRLRGFEDFEYDYVAEPSRLAQAKIEAMSIYHGLSPQPVSTKALQNLQIRPGRLRQNTVDRLVRTRDETPIIIAE